MDRPVDKRMEVGVLFGNHQRFLGRGCLTILCLCFSLFFVSAHAGAETKKITVDIFLSSTCKLCQNAHHFFLAYQKQHPELSIRYFWINLDKTALEDFHKRLLAHNELDYSVPSFFFCGAHWRGFSALGQSNLLRNIQKCEELMKQQVPAPEIARLIQQDSLLNTYLTKLSGMNLSRLFLPVIALIDAFNPCALFFLVTFLIFVFLSPTPAASLRIGMISVGSLAIGLSANLIFPETFHRALFTPVIQYPTTLITGLLLLGYIPKFSGNAKFALFPRLVRGTQESSCIAGSPFREIIAGVVCLVIYSYQQTCPLNLSKLFSLWPHHTTFLGAFGESLYIVCYLICYLLLPACFVLLAYLLKKRRISLSCTSFYRHMTSLFLVATSLLLMFSPSTLSSFSVSLSLLFLVVLCSWILSKWKRTSP